jgi:MarR family transcriptional regulator for hemolysin
MLQYNFDESVGYWVTMASQAIRRVLGQRLSEQDLTLRQWEVLAMLACNPDLSQTQMADRMGIEPATLAGVVNRMERDGWIIKTSSSEDLRQSRLFPTPQAESIWKRSLTLSAEVRAQAIAGVSQEDLQTLRRICATIRDNLSKYSPPPAAMAVIEANSLDLDMDPEPVHS